MQLDKQFVLEELRKAGKDQQVQQALDELRKAGHDEHVEKAVQELPEKIDHDRHAQLLEKFGLDPGKLAEKAAERGLAEL